MQIPDLSATQWFGALLMFLMFFGLIMAFLIRMMVTMQLSHDSAERALDRQSFELRVMGVMDQHRTSTQEIIRTIQPLYTTTQDTNNRVKGIEDTLGREGIIIKEIQAIQHRLTQIQQFIAQKGD